MMHQIMYSTKLVSCSHWGLFVAPNPMLFVPDNFEIDEDRSPSRRPGAVIYLKPKKNKPKKC
jgi:hypothetical protein